MDSCFGTIVDKKKTIWTDSRHEHKGVVAENLYGTRTKTASERKMKDLAFSLQPEI